MLTTSIPILVGALWACGTPEPASVVQLDQIDVVKLPDWEVEASSFDAQCGGLLDYCVRGLCTVRSRDLEPSRGTVVLTLDQKQGRYARRAELELGPTGRTQHEVRFTEARMLGGKTVGSCEVEYVGTRVRCTVTNTGAQPHEVTVVATLTDEQGAPSAEQRESGTIAPGERRVIPFLFDKINVAGECNILTP